MVLHRFAVAVAFLSALHWQLALAQDESTSSACSLEGPNNCQLFDGSTNRTLSDRSTVNGGVWTAEDFVPQSDTLQSLCVWGQYINTDPQAPGVDCASTANVDSFLVKVFANGSDLPDSPVVWSTATSTRTPALVNRDTTDPVTIYRFELVLDSPITGLITDGRAYWLEVSNWSSSQDSFYCYWHWSQLSASSIAGNRYSAKGREWGYGPFDERAVDFAFCMNMDIAPGGMGSPVHPCCRCDGSCELTSLEGCDQLGGTWNVTVDTCASVSCPSGAPANDTCSMKQALASSGAYLFNTTCAGTELVNPVETELGPASVGKDIWFSYNHEFGCDLTFYTCYSRFDTVIALYFDPNNPDVCPCPTDENLETFLVASDEGCTYAVLGEGGLIRLESGCDFAPFGCYTIRIGGFSDDSGIVILDIGCAQPDPSAPPPIVGSSAAKTRFISFSVSSVVGPCGLPGAGQLAIRVTLTSLHHVAPPYTGGPSIPFSAFEGQVRWVGPPSQYVESTVSGVPFFASILQCNPHYRDWSTIDLFHVTGSAIVPSSTYHVETVLGACEGQENIPSCQSGGFNVSPSVAISTTRWGDLEVPYNPPSLTIQPDVGDIAALVGKFRNAQEVPIKARAIQAGIDAFGNISAAVLSTDLNFSHIASCVDAFRGRPYPYTIQACP